MMNAGQDAESSMENRDGGTAAQGETQRKYGELRFPPGDLDDMIFFDAPYRTQSER